LAPYPGKILWAGYELPANTGYNGDLDPSLAVVRVRLIGGASIVPTDNRDRPSATPPVGGPGAGLFGAFARWAAGVNRNG